MTERIRKVDILIVKLRIENTTEVGLRKIGKSTKSTTAGSPLKSLERNK